MPNEGQQKFHKQSSHYLDASGCFLILDLIKNEYSREYMPFSYNLLKNDTTNIGR